MSELIEGLSNLSVSEQEKILIRLSKDLVPLEIDDEVYLVPQEVGELVDNLSAQVLLLTETTLRWQKKEKLKM
jgi:hypothetical protein|tara:strand:+ start:129 stop:347 length:219 start_codon:yes stop_codon:yes gene_type:complete